MPALRSLSPVNAMSASNLARGALNMETDSTTRPTSTQAVASPTANKSETKDCSTSPVSTRVGRNTVDIDVPALRHLVDTVKDKLKA